MGESDIAIGFIVGDGIGLFLYTKKISIALYVKRILQHTINMIALSLNYDTQPQKIQK